MILFWECYLIISILLTLFTCKNVVLELDKKGKQDIWAVHDSFGVHACDIDKLREIVNRTFVEIHQDPIQVHLKRIVELNRSILEPKFVDNYIARNR